jgi:hypothetical protein
MTLNQSFLLMLSIPMIAVAIVVSVWLIVRALFDGISNAIR